MYVAQLDLLKGKISCCECYVHIAHAAALCRLCAENGAGEGADAAIVAAQGAGFTQTQVCILIDGGFGGTGQRI